MAENYNALRHKHRVTPTFARDTGFDTTRATNAHASIHACKKKRQLLQACSKTKGFLLFVPGEEILARRPSVQGRPVESWGGVELLDGWHRAEVVKVRHAGSPGALYNVR